MFSLFAPRVLTKGAGAMKADPTGRPRGRLRKYWLVRMRRVSSAVILPLSGILKTDCSRCLILMQEMTKVGRRGSAPRYQGPVSNDTKGWAGGGDVVDSKPGGFMTLNLGVSVPLYYGRPPQQAQWENMHPETVEASRAHDMSLSATTLTSLSSSHHRGQNGLRIC